MTRQQILFLALFLVPLQTFAEPTPSRFLAHGFGGAFDANGVSRGSHIGGGGELLLRRLSVGAEAGLFDRSPFANVGGTFYAPGVGPRKAFVPFLKGGITALSSDSPTWIHFGGGIDY